MFSELDRAIPFRWQRIGAFVVAPLVIAAGGYCLYLLGLSIWDFAKVSWDDKLAAVPRLMLLPLWTMASFVFLLLGITALVMAMRNIARIPVSPETAKEHTVTPAEGRTFKILYWSSLVITWPVSIVVLVVAQFFVSEDWRDLIAAIPIVIGLAMFFGSLLWIGIYIACVYWRGLRARRKGADEDS